jgi:hypothetical protein
MNNENALLLFIKAPRLGHVKTRLQPEFSQEDSLLFYRALVEDLIMHFHNVDYCELKLFFWPPGAKTELQNWLGKHLEYISQYGSELGEKMHNAFLQMFAQKYKKVVIVGSDIPKLSRSIVSRAFSSLNEHDLILGPSTDGGYYLIGLKESHAELFNDIHWSTNSVLAETLKRAQNSSMPFLLLDELTDIDTFADVERLWHCLNKSEKSGLSSDLVNTYQVLSDFFVKLNY